MKIKGETNYLWRVVDHEGEVLESYATKRWNHKAALKFLKKTMKLYGRPYVIVTDLLQSYGAAMKVIGNAERQETGVGRITEPRTHICLFVEENGQYFASVDYAICRKSLPFIRQFTTTSTKNATSTVEKISNPIAPRLSPNGVNSVRYKGRFHSTCRGCFAFV